MGSAAKVAILRMEPSRAILTKWCMRESGGRGGESRKVRGQARSLGAGRRASIERAIGWPVGLSIEETA